MSREIIGQKNNYIERSLNRSALTMGAVLVGGLIEIGRTYNERRQPVIAGVKSYFEDDGPSFIFIRGCGENYQAQAPLFHNKFQGNGSMHFEYQIQGKHSQEIIDQNIIKACKSDGDRDRVLIATSMGTMNGMRSLLNPTVREAIGQNRLKAFISLSGITSKYDLQPNMQTAAAIASRTPSIPLMGDLWRMHRLHRSHADTAHDPETSLEVVRMHHESSAYMPYHHLVKSQYQTINASQPFQYGSHRSVVDENPDIEIIHITAPYDSVADQGKTNRSLRNSFGITPRTVIDHDRPHGSHADDIEYPKKLRKEMKELGRCNRSMTKAATNLVAYSSGDNFSFAV